MGSKEERAARNAEEVSAGKLALRRYQFELMYPNASTTWYFDQRTEEKLVRVRIPAADGGSAVFYDRPEEFPSKLLLTKIALIT